MSEPVPPESVGTGQTAGQDPAWSIMVFDALGNLALQASHAAPTAREALALAAQSAAESPPAETGRCDGCDQDGVPVFGGRLRGHLRGTMLCPGSNTSPVRPWKEPQ